MTVTELIEVIKKCDPTTTVEDSDGSDITWIAYHAGMRRLEMGYEDSFDPKGLSDGWTYIYTE